MANHCGVRTADRFVIVLSILAYTLHGVTSRLNDRVATCSGEEDVIECY